MHPVTSLRKINCLPCSSSSLEVVIASLEYLLKIYGFMLAGWVTAGEGSKSLAIQVIELPWFINMIYKMIENSIAALLLTVQNIFLF